MELIAKYLWTSFICFLPLIELRGGIPYAVLFQKLPVLQTFLVCVGTNILISPAVYIFLSTVHKLLVKWEVYNNFFEKMVERTRKKIHDKVEKYGFIGIALYVAIPLPVTGAYTGTLGAWILGISKPKTILAVSIGVIIAGILVTMVVLGGEQMFGFIYKLFIKEIH
jgi:uncharacterized membrane protein